MPVRTAKAEWKGNLQTGNGVLSLGSGAYEGQYNFSSRFEEGKGTNPEELIGAAHAGCYSMALSAGLSAMGCVPDSVQTSARVHIEKVGAGFKITLIELDTIAVVPGIDEKAFLEAAEATKTGCPVSQALAATEIKLNAKLVK